VILNFSGFSAGALASGNSAGSFNVAGAVGVGPHQVNSASYEFVFYGTQASYLPGNPVYLNTVVNDYSHTSVPTAESQYGSTFVVEDVKTSTANYVQYDQFPGGGANLSFSGTNIAVGGQLGLARLFTLVSGPVDLGSTSTQSATSITNYTCRQFSGGSVNVGVCLDYDPYTWTTLQTDIIRNFATTTTTVSDYSLGFSLAGAILDAGTLADLSEGMSFDFDLDAYGNIGLLSARLYMDISPTSDASPATIGVSEPGSLALAGLGLSCIAAIRRKHSVTRRG